MAPSILPGEEDKLNPTEVGTPGRERPCPWALKNEQTLVLEVRRIHLAQQIEDLEWELSLLLQAANSGANVGGIQPPVPAWRALSHMGHLGRHIQEGPSPPKT